MTKTGFTLNDLYDGICMIGNRFSGFHCVYTFMQVVHTNFIKVVLTEYSAFKNSSQMIQEEAAATVITVTIYERNRSTKKRQKRNFGIKP